MNVLQTSDMSAWATNSVESNRQSISPSPQIPNYGQQLHQQQLQNQIIQQQSIGRPLSRQMQQSPPVGNAGAMNGNSLHNQSLLPSFVTSSASATDLLLQQSKLLEKDAFGGGSSQSLTGANNNINSAQMINNALGLSSHHHLSNSL